MLTDGCFQLNWTEDCREGRFLLKSNNSLNLGGGNSKSSLSSNSKLENSGSKRKKKESASDAGNNSGSMSMMKNSLAAKLFSEKPETSFTKR